MGSSKDDTDSYVEEERVFDFGEEEDPQDASNPAGVYRDYGGEDFSNYLHDDEGQLSPSHTSLPAVPRQDRRRLEAINHSQSVPEPEDFYDTIDDAKGRDSTTNAQKAQSTDVTSPYNNIYDSTNHHYNDTPMQIKYKQNNQPDKNNKLTQRLKKHLEKATLRFSKNNSDTHNNNNYNYNSNNTNMHNFSFADSKMGSSLVEQTDSGIGLEGSEDTEAIQALTRNSWWSVGTLSNKPSPSSTLSQHSAPLKGGHSNSSSGLAQRHKKPPNNTVKSLFKKVTGTLKINNNNNLNNHQ